MNKNLPSLRTRYISLATILVIIVFFLSGYSYLNVRQVQQNVRSDLKDIGLQRDKLQSIRNNHFDLYRNIELFLLDPLVGEENIHGSLNSTIENIQLFKTITGISDTEMSSYVRQLSEQIIMLKSEINSLIKARMDVRMQYPGVSVSAFEMSTPQQATNGNFRALIYEIENKDFEPSAAELYPTLMQAETLWVRLISQMRIYLANRLASFTTDILIQQAESLDVYYQQLMTKLSYLERLYSEEDSFEGPDILESIKKDVSQWRAHFSEVRRLSEMDSWRADSHIMKSIIIPLSDKITSEIRNIELFLSDQENTLSIKHENNSHLLSQLLLSINIVFLVFIVGLILSVDWLIFRPLQHVSEVFKSRALDSNSTKITKPNNSELANLIESFQEMDKQILQRHHDLEQQAIQLTKSEERWNFALEGAGDGVWDWNPQTDEALYSRRWNEIIGYLENEFPKNGSAFFSHIHNDDKELFTKSLQECLDGKKDFQLEFRMYTKGGDSKWVLARGKVVSRDANGKPIRVIGTHTDITDRKHTEEQLKIAATTFESNEGIVITDPTGTILRVNSAFIKTTGYTAEEAIGQNIRILKSGRHDKSFYEAMWSDIHTTGFWQGEVWDRRKNGEIFPKWLTITAVRDSYGQVTHYVGTHFDISKQKEAEEQIRKLAFFDPLTGLPNRTLLQDRIEQNMSQTARNHDYGALLLIDLDNFKMLNDTLGHDAGDKYLQEVAERLKACVRDVDTVARLGGDEFVVILAELTDDESSSANSAEHIAESILSSLNQSYTLNDKMHHSSASIGISLFQGNKNSREEVMKQADLAMYKAKSSGRNTIRFFDPVMESSVLERAELEKYLHEALRQKQFTIYYQGQFDLSNNIIGAEALVRWIHPQRGLVSPAEFIPIAEETGLILALGDWVLETACNQLVKWASHSKMASMPISVNVSAKQFNQDDFVDRFTAIIARTGANPNQIKLELTESLLIENIENIIEIMTNLKELGVHFSLDDFGTGYSSLSYLRRLPLDQLKIDRSFVSNISENNNDLAIAKTIIDMGKSLDFEVIAEGVETELQRHLLEKIGCKNYQGYLICKPLPIEEFEAFIS